VTVGAFSPPNAAEALTIPDPQFAVEQPPDVGKARAVPWIADKTCAGVSAAFCEKSRAATPATCGVAMLVPL
jgi:hypothetical protein